MRRGILIAIALLFCAPAAASAQVLVANTTANNGGSPGWAIFFDLSASGSPLTVTQMTTASTATAGASFNVEVLTRTGTALGGPVGSGPGSSSAGWTSLGTVSAMQGATANGISLPIDIPDISVPGSGITGVAVVFSGVGPRYFGTGTGAYQTFTDGMLSLVTGDARTAPFTTTGSWFAPRGLTGSLTYTGVPEPASVALITLAGAGLMARRRR